MKNLSTKEKILNIIDDHYKAVQEDMEGIREWIEDIMENIEKDRKFWGKDYFEELEHAKAAREWLKGAKTTLEIIKGRIQINII